jgi:hypothetical protein
MASEVRCRSQQPSLGPVRADPQRRGRSGNAQRRLRLDLALDEGGHRAQPDAGHSALTLRLPTRKRCERIFSGFNRRIGRWRSYMSFMRMLHQPPAKPRSIAPRTVWPSRRSRPFRMSENAALWPALSATCPNRKTTPDNRGRRLMITADAVDFVRTHGVVLESATGPVPSLAAVIAGGQGFGAPLLGQ